MSKSNKASSGAGAGAGAKAGADVVASRVEEKEELFELNERLEAYGACPIANRSLLGPQQRF